MKSTLKKISIKCALLFTSLACFSLLQGCTVMYFHNGNGQSIESIEQQELTHYKTQHDGIYSFIEEMPVSLDDTCDQGRWETAKMENTFADVIIRLIANPLYGTSSVTFECEKDAQLAQVDR